MRSRPVIRFGLLPLLVFLLPTLPTLPTRPRAAAADFPRDLKLTEDLVLGLDPDLPLGRVADVEVDSRGRILVLDGGFDTIHIFDPDGQFLFDRGRIGEGPGEFGKPRCLAVGPEDRVYVAGSGGVIASIEADGTPGPSIRCEMPGLVHSMAVDEEGSLYVVIYDHIRRRMIHRYNMDVAMWTISFGESYADTGSEPDPRVGFAFAVGFVDFDERGDLYYAQLAPQEIRVYSPQGRRLRIHAARGAICPPPPAPEYHGESVSVRAPSAMCFSLVCLPGDLWLTALNLTDEHPDGPAVLVDVYDREGVLRYTQRRAQVGFGAYCADNEGRVYVAEVREELPVVVRYRLELE